MSRAQSPLVLVPRARNGPYGVAAVLHDAIEDVIDIHASNRELEAEEKDSAEIIAVQKQTREFFKSLKGIG